MVNSNPIALFLTVNSHPIAFFFKQKTAYEITTRLVGSEMCIRDRRHLLIEIAPSQFIKEDQTDHMSHKLSEKLNKLGPSQRLLTTKSDLTQMTT